MTHGLKSNDINDGKLIAANGYSNLENYLNSNDVVTAQQTIYKVEHFSVYPNPGNSLIHFQSSNKVVKIIIYDISGKMIDSLEGTDIHEYSIESFHSGIYFVKAIFDNHQVDFQKIVKI